MNNIWIDAFLQEYKGMFFISQVMVTLFLTLLGFVFVNILGKRDKEKTKVDFLMDLSLAFPVGLSIFIIVSYITLVVGIPYKNYVLGPMLVLILGVGIYIWVKRKALKGLLDIKKFAAVCIMMLVILVLFAVSGLMKISISNDSLYYFWQYPRAICHYGGLRDQFDNFMTDTGLGAAIIGTLPFLFGFGETFGIQEFFHMSFLVYFGVVIINSCREDYKLDDKKSYVISGLSVLLLMTCTSSYILAHWAMSNMFFMEYFFIGLSLAYRFTKQSFEEDASIWILGILIFACSSIRMEGGIFILFLLFTASMLNMTKRNILIITLPVVILQSAFELKIFITYVIDNPYIFLTKEKALLQFIVYMALIGYCVLIRDRLSKKLSDLLPMVLMLALLGVNGGLCISNSTIYISNLKAFFGNLTGQSGWGILPYVGFGAFVIILIWELIINSKKRRSGKNLFDINKHVGAYWLYCGISFLLITLAVAFARGDALNVNTGDSGNRVLLQITPIVIVTFVLWFVGLVVYEDNKEEIF